MVQVGGTRPVSHPVEKSMFHTTSKVRAWAMERLVPLHSGRFPRIMVFRLGRSDERLGVI